VESYCGFDLNFMVRDGEHFLMCFLDIWTSSFSQGNTEHKEKHWRYHNTQLYVITQSHSDKNSVVLAQNQI
jgi:hypothetical protein